MATTRTLSDLYAFDSIHGTVSACDTSEVKTCVTEDIEDALGAVEASPSTPMGRIIEWLTMHFAGVMRVNVQNANQFVVSAAAGQQLDAMAQWFCLKRKGATKSQVTATLTGTAGVTIPAGVTARTERGDLFDLNAAVTITSKGTAQGLFLSREYGAIPCAAEELTIMDTAVSGWSSVTNDTACSLGDAVETDDALRSRIMAFRNANTGFIGSIKNAIDSVSGVRSAMVLENNTGAELDVQGVPLAPHTIFVCIDGVTDLNKYELARAVFNAKSSGTGYTRFDIRDKEIHGPTAADDLIVTDEYGNQYPVYMYAPEACNVITKLVIKRRGYAGTDLSGDVKSAVLNWASERKFGIGDDVYGSDVARAVESTVGGIVVVSTLLSDGGVFVNSSWVEVPGNKIATFTSGNISVEEFAY